MKDDYNVNLKNFKLSDYQEILESARVLPGRTILKDNLKERFDLFRSLKITNLEDLLSKIKTKKKIVEFSNETGLSIEYLTIQRRHIMAYKPKPVYLKDISGVNQDYVDNLSDFNIKNSKQLFQVSKTQSEREELSKKTNVPLESLMELVKLADLLRCGGVGPLFARMIYETGTDNIDKLSNDSPEHLFNELIHLNEDKNYTRAKFVLEDIEYCINFAKKLPKSISY
ncbi:DUF4332 domain-containing protein [Methanobacterium alcaliphilum]|uniref:DUF4332 domain-containing protein n=1 Tax=Methanobacterium alcaliphilum TaxID=392018 RepID=UPI00200A15DC|nr:DUF4332 domain-containing protein [Methanobacterium alcaliphilum]MCK9152071.1 DUF4332 domain-containing protein [Methanobacterium alcaliphilum]